MLLVQGDNVDVEVKYHLTSGFAVVLHNSDAFSRYCVLHGVSHFLHDFVQVRHFFLWNRVNVLGVFLWHDECVTDVYGLYAREHNYFLVLVDNACSARI